MKKSKFTDSQILSILKQAVGGVAVPDLCREHVVVPPFLADAKSRKLSY